MTTITSTAPGRLTVDYGWTGADNASTSTQKVNGVVQRTNLVPNPSAASSLTGWNVYAGGNGAASLGRGVDASQPGSGGGFGRATWSASPTDFGGGIWLVTVPVVPGSTYSFSAYARHSVDGQGLRVRIEWSGGAFSGATTKVPAGQWARYATEGVVIPSGVTAASITVYAASNVNWPVGATLDVGAVLAEQVSTLGSYFDGATPDVIAPPATTPLLVVGYQSSRDSRSVFHQVQTNGAPADDVALRPVGPRTGRITYLYATEADSDAAEQMHRGPYLFTLVDTDRPTVNMTYAVDGQLVRTLDPETGAAWLLEVGFREVAP